MSGWGRVVVGTSLIAVAACGMFGDNSGTSEEAPPPFEAGSPAPPAPPLTPPPPPVDSGTDADAGPQQPSEKRVFVTSNLYAPNLGNLAAYDKKCDEAAGTDGGFFAWMSTSSTEAKTRLPTNGGVTYFTVAPDGGLGPAFNTVTNILSGNGPQHNVASNAQGAAVTVNDPIWTGTNKDGTKALGSVCLDWTSASNMTFGRAGAVGKGDVLWSAATDPNCNLDGGAHILCFEK